MKRILILLTMMVFVLVMASCETKKIEKNDETIDEDVIEVDTETDNDSVTETDDDQVVPDEDVCGLPQDWLAPASEWEAWGYLRMSGEIGDYNGDYVEATFTEGKMKIASGTTDLGLGSFMNYQGTTLLADAVAYEFISQTASLATVDYYDAMWQFSSQLVPLFKEDGAREADFAAFVWFRNSFIDLVIQNQQITEQRTRKSCWLALAATEEVEEEGETYDVPVGGIYGCFDDNVDGSVGETLKMMFRNKMTDNRDDILTFINTLEDNTVLEYGDEGFRFECECYNENGATATVGENEVPCWQYDGPGGAEECPAEVEAAGKCGEGAPDEDIVDEDVVDEENPDADGISSKMVPCDQTGVTAPANAAIVVADVEVTWTGEGWTAPAKCVWACNENYMLNEAETGCEKAPEIKTDFDEEGTYVTGTEFSIDVEINSYGKVDQLSSISYAFYKDDVLVVNMTDITTKAQYTVRSQGENYVTTQILTGSGTVKADISSLSIPDVTEVEAFTLGIFDTYCVDRNRPVKIDVNFSQTGEYRLEVTTNECFNNTPIETGSSFTANTKEGCVDGVHKDYVNKNCKDPAPVNVQSIEFDVTAP